MSPHYITTTLPYVNGAPHIGHTIEFIRADIYARSLRAAGHEVFFNTGTDEHGQKIADKAAELGKTPQEYVDEMVALWYDFCTKINMSYDFFSRTTADHHIVACHKIWQLCDQAGYIYKKQYQAKYCVGCELEKTDSELVDGRCPDHPDRELELIDEENYFFAFSKFQQDLLELYKRPNYVIPEFRLNEIRTFVEGGLQDFSISRLKSKMSWGVPVPGDDDHVMYVWFDALTNYLACLGWGGDDQSQFEKFWQGGKVAQIAGKDNLRQQTAIWQAMAFAAGIKNTDQLFIEGHVMSGGTKMSKSIGNVVDPIEYIDRYGLDAVRYFICRHVHNVQDSDWTRERFEEAYTADLVNGLGNLTNRVLKMSGDAGVTLSDKPEVNIADSPLHSFDFNAAADHIWRLIGAADEQITRQQPYKLVKTDPAAAGPILLDLLEQLYTIATLLQPILPDTSQAILAAIEKNQKPEQPLFPRLEKTESVEIQPTPAIAVPQVSIDPSLAQQGVKVAAAICHIDANPRRRGADLDKHIAAQLDGLDLDDPAVQAIIAASKQLYAGADVLDLGPNPAEHLRGFIRDSGDLPNINRAVDCYNVVSATTGLSAGMHDLQGINGDVVFRPLVGGEAYTPLGKSDVVAVPAGGYACMDAEKILCYLDTKQCDQSKITTETRDFLVYMQGADQEAVDRALGQVCENIEKFCGGRCTTVTIA